MNKIKTGDEVIVLTGKNKGSRGKVLRMVNDGKKLIVDGINIAKKHVRPNPNTDEKGGIKDKAMPIDISNVALFNPKTNKADRVGFRTLDDGTKVRYFKGTNEDIVE